MHSNLTLLAAAIALGLTGCVTAHTTMLTPSSFPPVPENDVYIHLHPDELSDACVRVALIHAEGSAKWTNERQMIEAARRKAGKAGGNALLIRSVTDPNTVTRIAAELLDGLPADRKGEMIAFRCPPPDATEPTDPTEATEADDATDATTAKTAPEDPEGPYTTATTDGS
jgi:hypothetical protein